MLTWSGVAFCGEIHEAARAGDVEKVKALLKANPDLIRLKDSNESTPLTWAVLGGQIDVVAVLLEQGADIDESGALHAAANRGQKEIAKLLLDRKANPNAKDRNGMTPLGWAAIRGDEIIAELLLAKGADVSAKDRQGNSPIFWAGTNGQTKVAKLLLAHKANPDEGLWGAASGANPEVIEMLLEGNANIHMRGDGGKTLLHRAASSPRDSRVVVEALLKHKADIEAKDDLGETPLHKAAFLINADISTALLANKADPNTKNKDGATPLHLASGDGFWRYNAMPDVKPRASRSQKAIVELLVKNGADPNLIDNKGKAPLDWALKSDNKDIAEFLRQHGAKE